MVTCPLKLSCLACGTLWLVALATALEPVQQSPLNVMLIVSDDLRPDLGGMYGQSQVWTPNLEALMDRSVSFSYAYCQYALCAPSRTSFLTGLRPDTTGVWDIGPYFRDTMPNGTGLAVTTLPQFFRESGYLAVGAGKVFHPGTSSGGPSPSEGGADMPYSWSAPYWFCDQFYNGTFQSTAMQEWPAGTGCVQSQQCVDCLTSGGCYVPTSHNTTCAADCADDCFPDGAVATQIESELKRIAGNASMESPFFMGVGLKRPHMSWFVPQSVYDMYDLDDIVIANHTQPPKDMPILAFNNHTGV